LDFYTFVLKFTALIFQRVLMRWPIVPSAVQMELAQNALLQKS